ncbi:MAG: hypothetical protein ACYSW8_25275 [Planctomycetota bacterium]|jgi:hypothetical protein
MKWLLLPSFVVLVVCGCVTADFPVSTDDGHSTCGTDGHSTWEDYGRAQGAAASVGLRGTVMSVLGVVTLWITREIVPLLTTSLKRRLKRGQVDNGN